MSKNQPDPHPLDWLTMPRAIFWLWSIFIFLLLFSIFSNFLFEAHGHFNLNDTFGFNTWYGFIVCAAIIFFAKLIGLFLKRPQHYYSDNEISKNTETGDN